MSSFFKSLSSFMNGTAGGSAKAPANGSGAETSDSTSTSDPGPSTLTTPLLPLDGADSQLPPAPSRPRRRAQANGRRDTSTEGAETVPSNSLVALQPEAMPHKAPRASASSRALNAVVRATTQVALPTQVDPTTPPRAARTLHRSTVVLTETEKLRLQVMQVQLKLTGLSLYNGPIDGMMNPELVEALRHFQTLKNMRDSGLLTAGTLAALGVQTLD